jgi:hypothetical protein
MKLKRWALPARIATQSVASRPPALARLILVRVKRAAIIFAKIVGGFVVLVVGGFFALRYFLAPPSEAKLLENFYAHRSAFEQLRAMLQEDKQISRLGEWGVHVHPGGISKPPEGNFPIERFQRYLALLKEARAVGVSGDDSPRSHLSVVVWRSGFAGDSVHIAFTWTDDKIVRLVPSFENFRRTHKAPAGKGWVCSQVDGNWYLCTDLWSR